MKKPVAIILVVVVLLAAGTGGWLWYQSQQDRGLTLYGNVDIRTVNMSFRVGGRLASLSVDEGDAIKTGQTLGMLDKAPYENALMQAKAGVSVAQAQYDLMLAGYRDEEIAQAAAAVKQAANSLNAGFGPIDILINNAGIVYDRQGDLGPGSIPSDKVETANWDNVITTDLNAVFYCCQAFGRHMLRRGRGNIISLSSMSARVGNFGRCNNAYCAAKAGVDMLTRQLAAEWGPKGIRVNAIAPGYMNTVMGRRSLEDPAIKKFITTMTPLGRPGEPEELQGLAVFLASDASAFITGQSIVIDGGYTLW